MEIKKKKTNSFRHAIEESERFIDFLNKKFNLNLPNNYLITISKGSKKESGFFMSLEHSEHYTNKTKDLNNINLNTYYLKTSNPYEVLTHEIAHFVNYIKKIKDCSSNQYHNKHFKKQAEEFLLKVERGKRGYSITSETEEFKEMLKEFKPNKDAFSIFQNIKKSEKVGSRLKLYMCDCGVKIRCAIELNARCLNCEGDFKLIV